MILDVERKIEDYVIGNWQPHRREHTKSSRRVTSITTAVTMGVKKTLTTRRSHESYQPFVLTSVVVLLERMGSYQSWIRRGSGSGCPTQSASSYYLLSCEQFASACVKPQRAGYPITGLALNNAPVLQCCHALAKRSLTKGYKTGLILHNPVPKITRKDATQRTPSDRLF